MKKKLNVYSFLKERNIENIDLQAIYKEPSGDIVEYPYSLDHLIDEYHKQKLEEIEKKKFTITIVKPEFFYFIVMLLMMAYGTLMFVKHLYLFIYRLI